ncbi:DUF1534 domain-containing protein [Pseudomonas syringae UB303]|uniref:DUF1534 domain-containing protein n=1 Tax=Pseudomonas syringae UB303 TaxID=1357287 RepID=A0AAJ4B6L7_PSESX|nr:DUF1534 domain-containing protein [Pseudomonas syringae UB303]
MGLSFLTLQRGNAVLDALRRKRTQSVRNGMRRGASHDNELFVQIDAELQHDSRDYRSSRSSGGMQFSTLCVARGRGASRTACDAERRTIMSCSRRPTQSFGTVVGIIVPHALV